MPFQRLSVTMANATSIYPAIARSDGSDSIVFAGNNYSTTATVVLCTPLAETITPTGYEEKHGGNYDLVTPYLFAAAPTPVPVPTLGVLQVRLPCNSTRSEVIVVLVFSSVRLLSTSGVTTMVPRALMSFAVT